MPIFVSLKNISGVHSLVDTWSRSVFCLQQLQNVVLSRLSLSHLRGRGEDRIGTYLANVAVTVSLRYFYIFFCYKFSATLPECNFHKLSFHICGCTVFYEQLLTGGIKCPKVVLLTDGSTDGSTMTKIYGIKYLSSFVYVFFLLSQYSVHSRLSVKFVNLL